MSFFMKLAQALHEMNIIDIFIVLMIGMITISCLFLERYVSRLKQYLRMNDGNDATSRREILLRVKLARLSYCTSYLSEDTTTPWSSSSSPSSSLHVRGDDNPFGSDNSTYDFLGTQYKLVDSQMEDAMWLFQRQQNINDDSNSTWRPSWFVLIRGTSMLHDVMSDTKLVWAVGHDENLDEFQKVVNAYERNFMGLCQKHNIRCIDTIELVGHSLGGCICESLLIKLNGTKTSNKVYKQLRAFVIDTPGTPDSYRRLNDVVGIIDNLIALNSVTNAVNTLTHPIASKLLVCGAGSNVRIDTLISAVRTLWSGVTLATIGKFVMTYTVTTHMLKEIQKFVESGDVRYSDPETWPVYSGNITKMIYAMCFGPKPVDDTRPSRQQQGNVGQRMPPNQRNDIPPESANESNFDEIPLDLSSARIGKAYKVSDLQRFRRSMDPERHMVIPLVGVTSVGKTSVLKAIMDHGPDNDTFEVSSTPNTTTFPAIVRYPFRLTTQQPSSTNDAQSDDNENQDPILFIMDMPGVKGTHAFVEGGGEFLLSHVVEQLKKIKEVVQVCCLVLNDTVDDTSVEMFEEIYGVLSSRIMVIRNQMHYGGLRNADVVAKNQLKNRVQWDDCEGHEDLIVKDVRLRRGSGLDPRHLQDEEGIEELKDSLLRFANAKFEQNKQFCNEAKAKTLSTTTVFLKNGIETGIGTRYAMQSKIATSIGDALIEYTPYLSWVDTPAESYINIGRMGIRSSPGYISTLGGLGGVTACAMSLPIGLVTDGIRWSIGRGPPDMKKQTITRVKNLPKQMIASGVGATIGTMILPGVGTQVGMFCGSMISNFVFESPTE